ncbi:hypothetical protein FSP39_013117 [Pinctada imbricata]|uniref:Uncharacterized protein n=1 Tax=Pinctada imbricata TaxID=66713 RepID=A0AA88XWB9_PINIB|nr:hypothetical protein FSP39_013117 [Pinctada imbricata]
MHFISEMAEIDTAVASVNKGSDKKEDMVLLLSPDTNWARFLTPAPLAISLLGELVLISSDVDFSLTKNEPEGGFKFLRHPSSFRTCLVQISNEGWSAFNLAHTNMDQIRLYSAGIEEHVRSAVKLLLAGTEEEISHILPNALGRVSDIADTCKDLAECIEEKFARLISVTTELQEVSTSAKGTYNENYNKTVAALDAADLLKKNAEENKRQMKAKCARLEDEINKAHDDFNKAIKNIPGAAKMLAVSFAEGFLNVIKGLDSLLFLEIPSARSNTEAHSDGNKTNAKPQKSEMEHINKRIAYTKAPVLEEMVKELFKIATGREEGGKLYPSLEAVKDQKVKPISEFLRMLKCSMLESETTTSSEKTIIMISTKGEKICDRLESLVASLSNENNGENGNRIADDAQNLLNETRIFAVKAKKKTATSTLNEQPQNLRQVTYQRQTSSILQAKIENARFEVEAAKHLLMDARERHERACAEMKKESEELQKVTREIAALNPKKVSFETIQMILAKGIRTFGKLQMQWSRLVLFFQSMSNLIKCSLHTTLHKFVDTASQKRKLEIDVSSSKVFIDMLIEHATQANRIAFAVQNIASTYVAVSDKHLMDRISGLGRLIALDNGNSDDFEERLKNERKQLHEGVEKAQQAITCLMDQYRLDYNNRIEERKRRFRNEIESVLPPISATKLDEIRRIVSEGITKTDEKVHDLV